MVFTQPLAPSYILAGLDKITEIDQSNQLYRVQIAIKLAIKTCSGLICIIIFILMGKKKKRNLNFDATIRFHVDSTKMK